MSVLLTTTVILASHAAAHNGGLNKKGCHAGSQPYHCHRVQEAATSVLVGVLSMGTVISIPQAESATATVALIDTTTGEVLWSDLKIGLQLDTSVAGLAMGSMPADIDPAINEAVVTNEIATTDVANASRTETTVEDNAAESAAMECAAGQAC